MCRLYDYLTFGTTTGGFDEFNRVIPRNVGRFSQAAAYCRNIKEIDGCVSMMATPLEAFYGYEAILAAGANGLYRLNARSDPKILVWEFLNVSFKVTTWNVNYNDLSILKTTVQETGDFDFATVGFPGGDFSESEELPFDGEIGAEQTTVLIDFDDGGKMTGGHVLDIQYNFMCSSCALSPLDVIKTTCPSGTISLGPICVK